MPEISVRIPKKEWLRRALTLTAVAAFVSIANACSESTAVAPNDENEDALLVDANGTARVVLEPGLEQTVTLEPKRLHPGDELHVRSVIRNTSNAYKKAEALVCQLEIRTDMNFQASGPLILCFAYSATVRLAPRDSLVLTAQGIVKDRPGRYTVVVRHLLRPDLKARVRVNVYPLPDATDSRTGG